RLDRRRTHLVTHQRVNTRPVPPHRGTFDGYERHIADGRSTGQLVDRIVIRSKPDTFRTADLPHTVLGEDVQALTHRVEVKDLRHFADHYDTSIAPKEITDIF